MTSILKQRVLFRRFKYLSNRFTNDRSRKISRRLYIPPLHPSQIRTDRNFVRLGGIISGPVDAKPIYSLWLGKFQKFVNGKSPNGNGDKDDSDKRKARDLEVKKLQDLRQRSIDHIYDQESVWKAMKERDELLRRDREDKERDEQKPDDNSK